MRRAMEEEEEELEQIWCCKTGFWRKIDMGFKGFSSPFYFNDFKANKK